MTIQAIQSMPIISASASVKASEKKPAQASQTLQKPNPITSYFTSAMTMVSGSAMTVFTLLGASASSPDIDLLSLSKGDELDIDGVTTMNGTATLKTLQDDKLELSFNVNVPGLVRDLADEHFRLKNGRLDLSLKVKREGEDFTYQLVDNHSGYRKGSGDSDISITNSSFKRSGLFGYNARTVKAQDVVIGVRDGDIKISIEDDPEGGVTGTIYLPMLPPGARTFDFTKK